MSLISDSYKSLILKTKRGYNLGVYSNAKPLLVLSIMDAIYEGTIIGNKIMFENDVLKDLYIRNSKYYQTSPGSLHRANASITPYNLPFFHLGAEPYYHIKWKEGVIPPPQAQSPSNKYLKGNVDFAFLDNELWDLLHDETLRLELRNALIEKFLI